MARSMPTASKARRLGRPAQGANSVDATSGRPRAAYRSDPAPRVVSQGTQSRPRRRPAWRPGTLAPDATPKIVRL